MFERKLLEITLILVYWVGFAYFAVVHIYYLSIVKPLGWDKNPSTQWPSLAIFVFILVVIYLVIRYLMLLLYARCKISEERLIAKTKQKVRSIKEGSKKSSTFGSTNLIYENEKLNANQPDENNNKFKRFISLNNITKPICGTIMKNGRSLDTVLDIEENTQRKNVPTKSLEQLIDVYEKPNYEKNLNKEIIDKYNKYEIVQSGKNITKHARSAENLLDYDKIENLNQSASVGNLRNHFENSYDVVDGAAASATYSPNTLRRAPLAPKQQQYRDNTATTLPRMPQKVKRLAPMPPPIGATMPRLHQTVKSTRPTPPPLPKTKPVLLKNVLVSNAKVAERNQKGFNV